MAAVIALDGAEMPAHIARQARMGRRMDRLGAHPIADREAPARGRSRSVGPPRHERPLDVLRRQHRATGFARCSCWPLSISSATTRPRSTISRLEAERARSRNSSCEIVVGRAVLARKARHVDVPAAGARHRERQRQGAALPTPHETPARSAPGSTGPKPSMPPMSCTPFIRRPRPAASAGRCRSCVARDEIGELLFAPALGALRDASAARDSGSRRSNPRPGFRCPAGNSTPKSRSTPRGSFTARERYGADLYQTGGSPSTGHG